MPDPSADTPKRPRQHVFQPPRGTRDFYPAEMLRRRWIEEQWRRTATRHGFEEIDGPRFEHADLYTVKSGEGILSELFSFKRAGGKTSFALRPEFTPTLARMIAARANSLPKPTKWFSVGPYFRAERPQRGRLREFLQWNVDILGAAEDDEETRAQQDAETIACCVEMLRRAGLTPEMVRIKTSDRRLLEEQLRLFGVSNDLLPKWFQMLDRVPLADRKQVKDAANIIGMDEPTAERVREAILEQQQFGFAGSQQRLMEKRRAGPHLTTDHESFVEAARELTEPYFKAFYAWSRHRRETLSYLCDFGIDDWVDFDFSIVRGLAYYTGMVFEVHEITGKERAIAGGGRYDNLVSLFGGPPTPAVGFAMGDVVLAHVLQDKGLMPSDAELRDRLGLRPDVFVISTGTDESEAALPGVVAGLRHAGMHARHTYKTTRNLGKLLKEAASVGARFAAILEVAQTCALKDLDSGAQTDGVPIAALAERVKAARAEADRS